MDSFASRFDYKARAVPVNYRHRFTQGRQSVSDYALLANDLEQPNTIHEENNYLPTARQLDLLRADYADNSPSQGTVETLAADYLAENCQSAISYNQSPDVPFDRSVNPYRGCEHGCVYCFARPSHAYLDFNPGLDFETKIVYRPNIVTQLERDFKHKHYQAKPLAIGMNTDAYQPLEKKYRLTRQILELCLKYRHPVTLLTKSTLIQRDIDLLSALASENLVHAGVSLTSLDPRLKNALEPRASSASSRLKTLRLLASAGVPTFAMLAPIIPALNDCEIEKMLEQVKLAGVNQAQFIMLRLPYELKPIFTDWLNKHYPYKQQKVLSYLKDIRDGGLNNSEFGLRMKGSGAIAQIIAARFKLACKKFAINSHSLPPLNSESFIYSAPKQMRLI
ncbi:MAG: PA0069 family radical SAM protein [Gammaproteobacteria bacterium]|nr:PA0069 family radical SAM protein [Gammaproteobacteria bacterium]NVK88329.1 PA0069 family radical SAM protein [Gammaproteobacteria bacterium]